PGGALFSVTQEAEQSRVPACCARASPRRGYPQPPADTRLEMATLANTRSVDDFVYSLSYDPKVLLAVVADGDISSQPVKKRGTDTTGVIITTTTQHKLSKSLSDVAILRPTAGVIFPGSAVLADRNLMDGQPTPIGLARA